jgi:hypothetical protein
LTVQERVGKLKPQQEDFLHLEVNMIMTELIRYDVRTASVFILFFLSLPKLPLLLFVILSGVRLSPLGVSAIIGLLYQLQMLDNANCGAVGGIKFVKGNRSTRRKPTPVPLCPPQNPYDLTRAGTRAAAKGIQRLTARTMARPIGLPLVKGNTSRANNLPCTLD